MMIRNLCVLALSALLVLAAYRRIYSRERVLAFVIFLVLVGAIGIYFVDTNVPLAQSHFKPDGEPAPVWVALLAWGTRVAAIFGLSYFGRWLKRAKTHA